MAPDAEPLFVVCCEGSNDWGPSRVVHVADIPEGSVADVIKTVRWWYDGATLNLTTWSGFAVATVTVDEPWADIRSETMLSTKQKTWATQDLGKFLYSFRGLPFHIVCFGPDNQIIAAGYSTQYHFMNCQSLIEDTLLYAEADDDTNTLFLKLSEAPPLDFFLPVSRTSLWYIQKKRELGWRRKVLPQQEISPTSLLTSSTGFMKDSNEQQSVLIRAISGRAWSDIRVICYDTDNKFVQEWFTSSMSLLQVFDYLSDWLIWWEFSASWDLLLKLHPESLWELDLEKIHDGDLIEVEGG